jgi:RNA polymerase sigma-70 factor (ECF subfamily)
VVTGDPRQFREQWGRVLAVLIGLVGDFDLAEEVTQEAFAVAVERWPAERGPVPTGWLVTTARNRAIDRIRRDRTLASKAHLLLADEMMDDPMEPSAFPDERL